MLISLIDFFFSIFCFALSTFHSCHPFFPPLSLSLSLLSLSLLFLFLSFFSLSLSFLSLLSAVFLLYPYFFSLPFSSPSHSSPLTAQQSNSEAFALRRPRANEAESGKKHCVRANVPSLPAGERWEGEG